MKLREIRLLGIVLHLIRRVVSFVTYSDAVGDRLCSQFGKIKVNSLEAEIRCELAFANLRFSRC